uniref:Uncharacterized protein n=1 Tax=Setaria italica TaxID=4555 RepID=K4AP06_SETIT
MENGGPHPGPRARPPHVPSDASGNLVFLGHGYFLLR